MRIMSFWTPKISSDTEALRRALQHRYIIFYVRCSTKKNFKTESTELYDLSYQYSIDCLTAGLVYRREFYEDADLEQKNNLMFTLTFVPFSRVNTPGLNP